MKMKLLNNLTDHEILCLVWNSKVQYRVLKGPLLHSILSQLNSVNVLVLYNLLCISTFPKRTLSFRYFGQNFARISHLPRRQMSHPSQSLLRNRDSSVGIVTDYGLDDRGSNPGGAGSFSLRHRVQTDTRPHPASYPMGTGGSFPGNKADGAKSWPLTSI
jgi:hypothetical protein